MEDNWRSNGNRGEERRSFTEEPCWGCDSDLWD